MQKSFVWWKQQSKGCNRICRALKECLLFWQCLLGILSIGFRVYGSRLIGQVCKQRTHRRSCHWECSHHAFVVCMRLVDYAHCLLNVPISLSITL